MMTDSGRVTGSRPTGHAACGVDGGSRFDPARLASLSFVLPFDDGGERIRVEHDSRDKNWGDRVTIRLWESSDNEIRVDLADLNWLIGALKLVAIATEAGTATTPQSGVARFVAGLDGCVDAAPIDEAERLTLGDLRALLARVAVLEGALAALVDAWNSIDEPFQPQLPRLMRQARAALSPAHQEGQGL